MSWKEVLSDENHVFSWRKTLTAIAALLFIAACIIYWIYGVELPGEYVLIISGVFAFYFLKNRISGNLPTLNSGNGNGNGNGHNSAPQYPEQPHKPKSGDTIDTSGA